MLTTLELQDFTSSWWLCAGPPLWIWHLLLASETREHAQTMPHNSALPMIDYSQVVIVVSPPQQWGSQLSSSMPLFKDKMRGTLHAGQQITKRPQTWHRGISQFTIGCPVLILSWSFSSEPQSVSCLDPTGLFSRSFLIHIFPICGLNSLGWRGGW